MNRLTLVVLTVAALQLNGSASEPAPRRPLQQVQKTSPIDDAMMRLLDDDRVRAELRLDEGQDLMLNLRVSDFTNARRTLVKNAGKITNPEAKQRLEQEVGRLKATLFQEIQKLLRPEQLVRLGEIKLQVAGPSCAFSVRALRTPLAITNDQEKKFIDAVILYEDALYAEFRKLPEEISRTAAEIRLMRSYDVEKKRLDKFIIDSILDEVQRKRLKEAMGRELVLDIDMMRPETLFTELSARANRGVPRYRRAYPLDAVVRLPAVRSLLQTSETENERLLACVAEWDKAQEAIYASLQFLHPRRQGTKYAEWEKCYNAALPVFENKLRDILGETRFERLKQVRRQIAGPQTLLGHEEVPGNPLTKDQRDRIDKARQELGAALHKWVMPVLMTRSYDHLEGLYDGHARASEKAVYGVFTPAQREGWAIMIGEPLDAGLLKSLRTDVGNQLQKLVVRKG